MTNKENFTERLKDNWFVSRYGYLGKDYEANKDKIDKVIDMLERIRQKNEDHTFQLMMLD